MSFSIRIEAHSTQVSFLQPLAPVDYPLPEFLLDPTMRSTRSLSDSEFESEAG